MIKYGTRYGMCLNQEGELTHILFDSTVVEYRLINTITNETKRINSIAQLNTFLEAHKYIVLSTSTIEYELFCSPFKEFGLQPDKLSFNVFKPNQYFELFSKDLPVRQEYSNKLITYLDTLFTQEKHKYFFFNSLVKFIKTGYTKAPICVVGNTANLTPLQKVISKLFGEDFFNTDAYDSHFKLTKNFIHLRLAYCVSLSKFSHINLESAIALYDIKEQKSVKPFLMFCSRIDDYGEIPTVDCQQILMNIYDLNFTEQELVEALLWLYSNFKDEPEGIVKDDREKYTPHNLLQLLIQEDWEEIHKILTDAGFTGFDYHWHNGWFYKAPFEKLITKEFGKAASRKLWAEYRAKTQNIPIYRKLEGNPYASGPHAAVRIYFIPSLKEWYNHERVEKKTEEAEIKRAEAGSVFNRDV